MLEKAKQLFEKLLELIKKHYIFMACVAFIIIGFDLLDARYWVSNGSEGEIIGGNIRSGLKALAGSILMAASLLSLAILRKISAK